MEIKGINRIKDAQTEYIPYRTLCFASDLTAKRYNRKLTYDYTEEANRILKEMREKK